MASKVAKDGKGKGEKDWPRTVAFGGGRVRIAKRGNGFFALTWREMGETRRTTKADEKKALEWAREKAIQLDSGDVKRWADRGDAEVLEALRTLAGREDAAMRRLIEDVRGAVKWLDGGADLTTAARWYAEHGPLKVERVTVRAAVSRFLAEYTKGPRETYRTFAQELESFADLAKHEGMLLVDLTEPALSKWCRRKVRGGKDEASPRTIDNRMTTWITFLNRCRDWHLLIEGKKHAGDLMRRPTLPDAGKEIFTVDQGARLLAAVREHDADPGRVNPRLEVYLLIGGWLGLRPSEIQRLQWEEPEGLARGGFDWARGYLHVSPRVAGKNSSERFVPIDPRLSARLQELFAASGRKRKSRCCAYRCREFLSVLARKQGVCGEWPTDVLRHSFCSYRIAVVKSMDQVATEADNSVAILKSNYRRPLRHEDGLAWWDLLGAP